MLRQSLVMAVLVGSACSVAYAQHATAIDTTVPATVVQVRIGNLIYTAPFRTNPSDSVAVVYNNWPDAGGLPFGAAGGTLHKLGDRVSFTPGPGMGGPTQITSLDRFGLSTPSSFQGGNVDLKFTFFDSYNVASTPMESRPLGIPVIITVAVPPLSSPGTGAVVRTPIDLTAANINVPDDDLVVVEELFPQGSTVPDQLASVLMPMFNGLPFPPLVGNSTDDFIYDFNGNQVFDAGEPGWFGGTSPFYANIGWRFSGVFGGSMGACCMPDGTCQDAGNSFCTAVGGTFVPGTCAGHGACAPMPTGSCCMEDGTCQSVATFACATAGGIYRGDGIICGSLGASCARFGFTGDDSTLTTDVGNLPGAAALVNGYGQRLTKIHGFLNTNDADMYKIRICDYPSFSASSVGGTSIDTILCLFDASGRGITLDDDTDATFQSLITSKFITANQFAYLAVARYSYVPVDAGTQPIWSDSNPSGGLFPEWAPNGPGAVNPIGGWTGSSNASGNYAVTLTGACFLGCYANCDGSTTPPILNANDFQCYLNSFAGGGNGFGYANCDNSSAQPVLNANDFQCFLNSYAAGCPS
jgi:hypothetical protein